MSAAAIQGTSSESPSMPYTLLQAVPPWLTQGWSGFVAANLPVAAAGLLAYVGEVPWGVVATAIGGACTLGVACLQYRIALVQARYHKAEDDREISRLRAELSDLRLQLTREIVSHSDVHPTVKPETS